MLLSEFNQSKELYTPRRICVYGPPKSGKTELVGALAAAGYQLHWFDLEDGIKTLLRSDSAAKSGLHNIHYYRIPDTQTNPIATNTLLKVVKGGLQSICFTHGAAACHLCAAESKKPLESQRWPIRFAELNVEKFGEKDILVVDSVSQWVSSTMCHITREQIAKGNDDYKPDWDDWRKQGFLLDRSFSLIQAGHFNCIGITHEEEQKLEGGTKRLVPVGGTGNYSKTFAKYWDDIVYTDVVNGKFRAYSDVSEAPSAIVGSRAGKKISAGQGLIELFK